MAVIVNGDGILTGVSSLTTALDDITSGRGTITGVTTVGTLQLGAGVSISSPRTQNLSIFTNDSEKLTVDDAGKVGIGTQEPDTLLHVKGTAAEQKLITLNSGNTLRNNYIGVIGADNLEIGVDEDNEGSSSSIRFRIDGSEKVRFHNAGRIGVNTDSPQAELHLVADNPNIEFNDTSTSNNAEITLDNTALRIEADEDNSVASSKIDFRVDGSSRFNIDSSGDFNINGNVGRFDSGGLIKTANGSASTPSHTFINDPDNGMYRVTTDTIALATGGVERLRINSDGRGHIGIGTGSGYGDASFIVDGPTALTNNDTTIQIRDITDDSAAGRGGNIGFNAYVNSASRTLAAIGGLKSTTGTGNFAGDLGLYTRENGASELSERLRILSDGSVIIGTTASVNVASSAAAMLQVEHTNLNISAALYSTADAVGPAGVLALGHGRGSATGVLQDNDVVGEIRFAGADGTDMQTQGALIQAQINGTPGSNNMPTDLVFYTNNGSASVGERLRILRGGGITFHGDTAGANTLNDYERGNYVPTVTGSTSGTGTLNASYNNLSYIKIGDFCHVNGRVRLTAENMTGTYVVVSLPFTIANLTEESGRTTGTVVIQNASQPPNGYVLHPVENNAYVQIARGNTGTSMANATNTFSGDEIVAISISFRTA